jgi:hypothetical protein
LFLIDDTKIGQTAYPEKDTKFLDFRYFMGGKVLKAIENERIAA